MEKNQISASELIIKRLEQHGIVEAFGVVGGAIMYITEALRSSKQIRSHFVHHEQSAAIAAESYAKLSNQPAIVFATAGPGVTNTLTGIADAYMDSIPMVVLVGDVRSTISADFEKQRYNAPQEVNQGALLKPLVKYYCYLQPELKGDQILEEVDKAISLAISGRMGPVCISVPLDMQGQSFDKDLLTKKFNKKELIAKNDIFLDPLYNALKKSKRPIILLGAGIRLSDTTAEVMQMIHKLDLPYCVSIGAVDLQNVDDPLSCGCVGPTSQRAANLLLYAADLIIALGTSFDQSITGFNIQELIKDKDVFLVNIDEGEFIRFQSQAVVPIAADLKDFFLQFNTEKVEVTEHNTWLAQCSEIKNLLNIYNESGMRTTSSSSTFISAYDISRVISQNINVNSTIVLGISLDAHSVFNSFCITGNQRVLVSRNLGPMGWDIPALLGAAVTKDRDGPIYLITGDGSFMVNIQELSVIAAKNIPACIFVFNNDGYVSIRTTQSNFFGNKFYGCDSNSGLSMPQLSGLANGFGFKYNKLTELTSIKDILALHELEDKPRIVECMIDPQQLREPRLVTKMENGKFKTPVICDMTPALSREKLKAISDILPDIFEL